VDDEILVRELDGVANLEEETQPVLKRERLCGAKIFNGRTGHIFHDEVRQAILARSGVEEPRYERMLEARHDLALRAEPAQHLIRISAPLQELDRDLLLKFSIRSLR
jgi:hypothetical protein